MLVKKIRPSGETATLLRELISGYFSRDTTKVIYLVSRFILWIPVFIPTKNNSFSFDGRYKPNIVLLTLPIF